MISKENPIARFWTLSFLGETKTTQKARHSLCVSAHESERENVCLCVYIYRERGRMRSLNVFGSKCV